MRQDHALKHAKSILSGIFTLARNQGVINKPNPVQGTLIPKKAAEPSLTHKATPDEVLAMLNVIAKQDAEDQTITREARLRAQAAIGLQFSAGLRPGEARGVCWEDFSGKRLTVRQSVWRTHTTAPKTAKSVRAVPIIEPLASILIDLREADGNPVSGPILRSPRDGKSQNLDNLYRRVVSPLLKTAEMLWYGWYSFRRGAGTIYTSLSGDSGLAAKGLLGHSNIATTQQYYIGDVQENTLSAAKQLEALCSKSAVETKQ